MKTRKLKKISNVTVINPGTGEVSAGRCIEIDKGKIKDIRGMEGEPAGGGGVLDGRGLFAIPGLIDTHVHCTGIFMEGMPSLADSLWLAKQQRKNLAAFLRAGVTTVRDQGSPLNMVKDYSRKAEAFDIESPRILYAGALLSAPGGYPDFVKKMPVLFEYLLGAIKIEVETTGQARRAVDRLADEGVHCIKVGFQSEKFDDARTKLPRMSVGVLNAICERAHDHGLPVSVHAAYLVDLPDLHEANFDSMEHAPVDGPITNEDAVRFHDRGVTVTTTFTTGGIIDHVDRIEELLDKRGGEFFEDKPIRYLKKAVAALRGGGEVSKSFGRKVVDTGSTYMRVNVGKFADAGVPISFGTDAGGAVTPCGVPLWEFLDMKRAGMSNLDMLRSATSVAAAVVGKPELGRLEAGAVADVVLLREDPLKDIRAIDKVAAVVRDGRLCVEK